MLQYIYRDRSSSIQSEKEGKETHDTDVNIIVNFSEVQEIDADYFNLKNNDTTFEENKNSRNKTASKSKKNSNDSNEFVKIENDENDEDNPDKKSFILVENGERTSNVFTTEQWNEIIKSTGSGSICGDDRNRLIDSLIYGIPCDIRPSVWKFLSKCESLALNHDKLFFEKLVSKENDELEFQIKKDIERTLIGDYDNEDQDKDQIVEVPRRNASKNMKRNLFHILKAYAIFDPQVGYCQGTNFIVMLILTIISSATDAFWMFVQIMHGKNWRGVFLPNTPKLMKLLDKLVNTVKSRIPDLYQHFYSQNFIEQFPGVFTHYFTTIFTYENPTDYALRIFDLFWLYEGRILIDSILHLLKLKRKELLTMNCEEMHIFLKHNIVYECLKENGLDKTLPTHYLLLEEKEIDIN